MKAGAQMVFTWKYTHFPGTGDAHVVNSLENCFQQTCFANSACFVSKQTGSDLNAQRYWQCHNEKIIKPLTHDLLTEFTYWDISEAGICERTEENQSDLFSGFWVLTSLQHFKKWWYEFNIKMSIHAISSASLCQWSLAWAAGLRRCHSWAQAAGGGHSVPHSSWHQRLGSFLAMELKLQDKSRARTRHAPVENRSNTHRQSGKEKLLPDSAANHLHLKVFGSVRSFLSIQNITCYFFPNPVHTSQAHSSQQVILMNTGATRSCQDTKMINSIANISSIDQALRFNWRT